MKIEEKIDELYVEHLSKFKEEPTMILMNQETQDVIINNFRYVYGINPYEINRPYYYRGIKMYRTPDLDYFEVLVK